VREINRRSHAFCYTSVAELDVLHFSLSLYAGSVNPSTPANVMDFVSNCSVGSSGSMLFPILFHTIPGGGFRV